MKFLIGKKQEMTQIWKEDRVFAVTKILVEPCVVTQVKTIKNDGYDAVQIGTGTRKEKNINKPQIGHTKDLGNFRSLREFRVAGGELKRGDKISLDTFEVGDTINIIGLSKGRGFQGVVRRHGFKGTDEGHGNKDQSRMPGSIGATGPAHVFKGTRMAGRMGNDRITIKNSEVIDIDTENGYLYIKGGVPGARNGLILINGDGELKIEEVIKEEEKEEIKTEEVKEESVEEKKEEAKEEVKEEVQEDKKTEEK